MDYKGLIEEQPDYMVCICMGIMYSEILNAIKQGYTSIQELRSFLMIGTGCTSCITEIEEILTKERNFG